MKKFAVLNLVLVLSLLLGTAALAQEGDFGVVQRTAEGALDGWKPVIGADALYENLNDGDTSNDPFIVSVRSAEHYAAGHIPGAINIGLGSLTDNLDKLNPDAPVYVYCYTGHSAAQAAALLQMLGYDAYSLKFGMCGWSADPAANAGKCFNASTVQGYEVEK